MFGFTGIYEFKNMQSTTETAQRESLKKMITPLCHTETQSFSSIFTPRFCLAGVCDGSCPIPYSIQKSDRNCIIALDGTVFNYRDLAEELNVSREEAPEEIILLGFMNYGIDFLPKLNGNFSIAIFDERHETLYLARDPFGTKPLFYTEYDNRFGFASELKALFPFRDNNLSVSREGLNEIFGIGPARTPGKAVFDHIHEVKPAHCLAINRYGICDLPYWALPCIPHRENYEETILHAKDLFEKAIAMELSCDTDPCCLLSGGVDSSLVASYLAMEAQKQGKQLTTISFDFSQNEQYFKSSDFQPSMDRPYIDMMVQYLGSAHHYLKCNYQTLADLLEKSMQGHDLPCMADIDSSLLYFCGETAKINPTAYTGECADEVFCGYPWLHKTDGFPENNFPWAPALAPRAQLLKDEFYQALDMPSYVNETYRQAVREIPLRPEDSPFEAEKRRLSGLNLYWFMETLLNRMDRCARQTGMTARIPFADKDLVSYVFNVPYEMKARNGLVKSLLRQIGEELLPQPVLMRKKSPFPKTYHPMYEKVLSDMLSEKIANPNSPLHQFIDKEKLLPFLQSPKDYGAPWYGQLMCGPQMMAYLIQIDCWIQDYNISIRV
ncbi:MAG: asparagine synthase (glutamine-hydrolyzing) [Lachnospiraceae bacterium]